MSVVPFSCATGDAPVIAVPLASTAAIAPPDDSVDSNHVSITGTGTINSFGVGATGVPITKQVNFVPTGGNITLTNGAALKLIGGVNRVISNSSYGTYHWNGVSTWTEKAFQDATGGETVQGPSTFNGVAHFAAGASVNGATMPPLASPDTIVFGTDGILTATPPGGGIGSDMNIAANLYYDGANWRYSTSGLSGTLGSFGSGGWSLLSVLAGTKDGVIPAWTTAFSVDVSGNASLGGKLLVNGSILAQIGGNQGGPVCSWAGASSSVGFVNSSNTLYFGNSDGNGVWQGNRANIDPNGNINANGAVIAATSLQSNGTTGLYCSGVGGGPYQVYVSGNYQIHQFQSAWYWRWSFANGQLDYVGNNSVFFTIDPSGNGSLLGNWTLANGTQFSMQSNGGYIFMYGQSGFYCDSNYLMFGDSGNPAGSSSWRYYYYKPTGNRNWVNNAGTNLFQISPGGACTCPGGFSTASDAATKRDIEPATHIGLNALRKITPSYFHRIHDEPPEDQPGWRIPDRREFGFIAQDVQAAFPDAVVNHEYERPGEGVRVKNLAVEIMPMLAALTNAVKELDERLVEAAGRNDELLERIIALEARARGNA